MSVLNSTASVNGWNAGDDDTIELFRPATCARCGIAAFDGRRVIVQGHGKVSRGFEGPTSVSGPAQSGRLLVRRFRCTACGCVMVVLPLEMRERLQYLWPAVATVLALWGIARLSLRTLRARFSAQRVYGDAGAMGWRLVPRWAAHWYGKLHPDRPNRRTMAAVIGQHLLSFAPPEFATAEWAARVWEGARRCVV